MTGNCFGSHIYIDYRLGVGRSGSSRRKGSDILMHSVTALGVGFKQSSFACIVDYEDMVIISIIHHSFERSKVICWLSSFD